MMARLKKQGNGARAVDTPWPSTRERLIATTADHLGQLGPRGVELRAVCQELGVSPSLVNYHFANPAELIYAATLYGYRGHVLDQRRGLDKARTGAQAVTQWVLTTIEWKRRCTGLAAVIDYPMLALGTRSEATPDDFVKALTALSRENVTTLGSGVYALLTDKPVCRISTARVAALIRLNREFAYWISTVGFAGQGAGTWIAGRKPYGRLWKAFGFDPDSQIRSTLDELTAKMAGAGAGVMPDPDGLAIGPDEQSTD